MISGGRARDNIRGGNNGNDVISGGRDRDNIRGGDNGNDVIFSRRGRDNSRGRKNGNDVIFGGRGSDNIRGGKNGNEFVFNNGGRENIRGGGPTVSPDSRNGNAIIFGWYRRSYDSDAGNDNFWSRGGGDGYGVVGSSNETELPSCFNWLEL